MRKRPILLILTACAVLALLAFVFPRRDLEPTYQGRSLTQWLQLSAANDFSNPQQAEAVAAVQAIGANAIPTILYWISYEPSRLRAKLMRMPQLQRLPGWLRRRIRYTDRAGEAEFALAILGPAARPAVPELVRLATTSSSAGRANRRTQALTYIGPDALRDRLFANRALRALQAIGPDACLAVVELMTNHSALCRNEAILMTRSLGTNANLAIRALLSNLQELDAGIVHDSIIGLEATGLPVDQRLAALMQLLQSPRSEIRCLGILWLTPYGSAASEATFQIMVATFDMDIAVRIAATNALLSIAPEALTKHFTQ